MKFDLFYFLERCNKSSTFTNFTWCVTKWQRQSAMYVVGFVFFAKYTWNFFCRFFLVNIGQNHSPTNATATPPSSSQTNPANSTPQSNPIPNMNNIPGVMAGGLDFSNIARSIGSMVQGITGQLLPGATLLNTMSTAAAPARSSSNTSQSNSTVQGNSNRSSTSTTGSGNNNNTDTVTEHMLTGKIRFRD